MFTNSLKVLEDIILLNYNSKDNDNNNMYNALEECITMCYNEFNDINQVYKNRVMSLLLPIINDNNFNICDYLDSISISHCHTLSFTISLMIKSIIHI
jgi:hypothetical protein